MCLQKKKNKEGHILLCLYVDDMLIIGRNDKMIKSTKDMLNSKFDMKDMGLADVIQEIKITRTSGGISLNQSHYVDKILEKFSKCNTHEVRTPIDPNQYLLKNKGVSQV